MLLFIPLITALPNGYNVKEQQYNIFQLGKPIGLNFLLTDAVTNEIINNNTLSYCNLITSNSQGLNIQSSIINYNLDNKLWGLELNKSEALRHFSTTGYYNYYISCDNEGIISGSLEINNTGYNENSDNFSYLILSVILMLGIFLYLASQYMNSDNTFGIGLYFYLISFVLLVYVLFLQYNLMDKTLYWLGLSNLQLVLFSAISYSLIGISFIGFTYLLIKYLGLIRDRKNVKNYGDNYDTKTKEYQY